MEYIHGIQLDDVGMRGDVHQPAAGHVRQRTEIIFITRVALLRADLPVVLCEVEPPRTKEMDASDDVIERIRRDGGLHEGPLGGEPIQLHAEQHLGRARQGAELHDFAGVAHEILAQVFPVFHRIGIGLGAGGMLGKTVYGKAAILGGGIHLANGRLAVGRVGMIMNVCNYHGLTLVVCFGPVEKTGMSRRSAYWLQFKETKPMSSVEYAIYPTSRTCFHWERTGPKVHSLPRKGLFPVCLLRTKAGQAPRQHRRTLTSSKVCGWPLSPAA